MRKQVFEYAHVIAKAHYIEHDKMDLIHTDKLSRDKWGHLIAHKIILSFNESQAEFF